MKLNPPLKMGRQICQWTKGVEGHSKKLRYRKLLKTPKKVK
jgi:hypothetical protein